jgi:hypothetical protein
MMSTSTPVERAIAHGAKFEQVGSEWRAFATRRGRALPLVILADPDKTEAARMFLSYFRIKE